MLDRRGWIRDVIVCMPTSTGSTYDMADAHHNNLAFGVPSCTVERTDSDELISGSQMKILNGTGGANTPAVSTTSIVVNEQTTTDATDAGRQPTMHYGTAVMETPIMTGHSYGATANR